MPIFFIALGLMLIFAVKFKQMGWPYLPTGADIWNPKDISELARHLVLPVSALVIIQTANYSRFIRSSILEVLGMDYVRTARAKGLSELRVLFRHVLKNALIPILTGVVVVIPTLFMGSLLTESFFGIPGLGSYTIDAIQAQDFGVVRAMVFLGSVLYIFGLILTDISYTIVDPRVRLQ
jgi:peptide/nickel transport system permease protein